MKQRISVRAIVKNDDKILLLRRASGRESILGKYELPGGTLEYGEQPDDALSRYLSNETGLLIQTAQLNDALSYIDHDDRETQYVFILYIVSIGTSHNKLELSQNYDRYIWNKLSDIQQNVVTESSKLLLGISQQKFTSVTEQKIIEKDIFSTPDMDHLIIYSDGGSRGNPGPSASGYIIMDAAEHVIHEGGMYLGITTNNQAEYHGVRLGLEKAKELNARTIDFRIDSMLVVNQMNGIYTIKNRELWPIHERIQELAQAFDKVTFTHVKREFNQLADGMVNKILNAHVEE